MTFLTSQPWTYTLIHFQLTQDLTEEFLTFTQSWLSLLKFMLKKYTMPNKIQLCKQSLMVKTMVLIKKNLRVEGELEEIGNKVLETTDKILECSGVKSD